jgi:hypothetical protein
MNTISRSVDTLSTSPHHVFRCTLSQKKAVYEGLAKFDKPNFNPPLQKNMLLVEIDFVEVSKKKN